MIIIGGIYAELASRMHDRGRDAFALVLAAAALLFLFWPVRKDKP